MSAALERGSGALVDREARAGDLGAAGVVDDVERLAELPVGLARPGGAAGRRVGADLAFERLLVGSCSPQVRMVTLASSPPTGTSGSGGFGMRRSWSSRAASTSASSASRALIRSPAAVEAALSSATSGPSGAAPPLMASPIRFEAALRSALRVSLSPSSWRRRASSSSARSTSAGSSPLSMRAAGGSASGSSRSRCRPTLMPPAYQCAAGLTQALDDEGRVQLASSQPARGPFGRPRNAR